MTERIVINRRVGRLEELRKKGILNDGFSVEREYLIKKNYERVFYTSQDYCFSFASNAKEKQLKQ